MPRTPVVFAIVLFLCGCMDSLEQQTKKSPDSIIGKTTQDVGKFDPNAGNVESTSKVHATMPGLAGVQAYGPMLEQIEKSYIAHAIDIFNANEGRYPKDYDEFMERIIKENQIKLPVLPGGKQYQYDEANHRLVVIEAPTYGK